MKSFFRNTSFLILLFGFLSKEVSAQKLDRQCIRINSRAQSVIQLRNTDFVQLKNQISSNVQSMIQQHSITNSGNTLSFENLASVVNVSNELRRYDKQYEDTYAGICEMILQTLWSEAICTTGMTFDQYKEELFDYLEEESFNLTENYAGTTFAQQLNFESALLKINAEEEEWLDLMGEDWNNNNPAFNQKVNNELYWPVLDENFGITLRNPESGLLTLTGYGKIKTRKVYGEDEWNNSGRAGGPMAENSVENFDIIEVLQFIFDNWDTIEDILDWIDNNITGDCHSSVSTNIPNDWRRVPETMSPDVSRRIYYHVRQKGVFGDFKATKTKIEGKAKLYKKKGRKYKKDWNNIVGIGYCTLQWNPCDNIPWPVNDIVHIYSGDHEHGKAKFKHMHPYALTIFRSYDFLTYYLYYNQQFTGEVVYALGSNISCE